MSTLHFFKTRDLTGAIVEGTDVLGMCGAVVEPQTRDGRPAFVTPTDKNVCGRCLTAIRSLPLAERQPRRLKQTVQTAPGAEV